MDRASKIYRLIQEAMSQQPPQQAQATKPQTRVQFDSQTDSPFVVTFSKRGFSVDDTRLSFEVLEDAISKEYSITLKSGLVLDAVKMQKILKYQHLY